VNWASLLLAVVFGTPGAVLLVRHKAHRTHAILIALAVLCLLAGVPSLLAAIGHPLKPGLVLLGIVALGIVFAMFFYFDVIRGEHKTPLMGRKAIGGGAGAPGGGGKSGYHVRPLVSSVGLVVVGLMIALNWSAVANGVGSGFGQTVTTITHDRTS
jgi:hypothetical protein